MKIFCISDNVDTAIRSSLDRRRICCTRRERGNIAENRRASTGA